MDNTNSWSDIIGNFKELTNEKFRKMVMNHIKMLMLHHIEYINRERHEHVSYDDKKNFEYPYDKSYYFTLKDKVNPNNCNPFTKKEETINNVTKEVQIKRKDIITFSAPMKYFIEFIINRAVKEIIEIWPDLLSALNGGALTDTLNLGNPITKIWLSYENNSDYSVASYLLLNIFRFKDDLRYFNDHRINKPKQGRMDNIQMFLDIPDWQEAFVKTIQDNIYKVINRNHPDNDNNSDKESFAYTDEISMLIGNVIHDFLKILAIKIAIRILYKREATIGNKFLPAILWDLIYGINVQHINNTGIIQFMGDMKDYVKDQSTSKSKKKSKHISIIAKNIDEIKNKAKTKKDPNHSDEVLKIEKRKKKGKSSKKVVDDGIEYEEDIDIKEIINSGRKVRKYNLLDYNKSPESSGDEY